MGLMTVPATKPKKARQREQDLWAEYLETTQECSDFTYEEVEPWAWARLLRGLGRRTDAAEGLSPAVGPGVGA